MDKQITHDEAMKCASLMGLLEGNKLYDYIAQQRAASGVRVVEKLTADGVWFHKSGQLKPGQSLAIIEAARTDAGKETP